jgi:hypothetical protein
MRSYIFFITILLVTAGCKQNPKLNLSDLKFPDAERDMLAANSIDTSYLISINRLLNNGISDTLGYYVFDKAGRMIYASFPNFFGYYITNKYDSLGFIKRKEYDTDFRLIFDVTYKFFPDSLRLYQYWSGDAEDTCMFRFNTKGQLIESIESGHDQEIGNHFKTAYTYDQNEKLQKKTIDYIIPEKRKNDEEPDLIQTVVSIFHSGNKTDSTIIRYNYNKQERSYTTKMIYDSNTGLPLKKIMMDSLITTYIHKKRKD